MPKKIVQIVSVVFFLSVFLEIGARMYLVKSDEYNAWGFNAYGYGDLLPNKDFMVRLKPELPYRVVTNNQGFRSDRDTLIPRPDGVYRILAVGDSFTFGPYMNNSQSYPAQLEALLNQQKVMGKQVEVINAGVMGYTLEDELSFLEEKGQFVKADLIVLGIMANDVIDYTKVRRQNVSRAGFKPKYAWMTPLYPLLKQSAVFDWVEKLVIEKRAKRVEALVEATERGKPETAYQQELQQYLADLAELKSFLTATKIPIVFLFFPAYEQFKAVDFFPLPKIQSQIGQEYDQVDLTRIFQDQPSLKNLYLKPLDVHLSALGNAVVASAVAEIVERRIKKY